MKRALVPALVVLLSWPALATSVSPTVIDLTSVGREASAAIRVHSTLDRQAAFGVEVRRLHLDENGTREEPSGDEFLVFPPMALVEPGATQVFRVQWVGEPILAESQSFMVYVSQLPLAFEPGATGVQLLSRFGVLVSVAPPDAEPALEVVAASPATTEDGRAMASFTVENSGAAHGYLNLAGLSIAQRDAQGAVVFERAIRPREVGTGLGLGLVPPHGRRTFRTEIELPSSDGPLEVAISGYSR